MSQPPTPDPLNNPDQSDSQDTASEPHPAQEPQTWQPPRGRLFYLIVWILLLLLALCVAVGLLSLLALFRHLTG